jgi:hypothetical protein
LKREKDAEKPIGTSSSDTRPKLLERYWRERVIAGCCGLLLAAAIAIAIAVPITSSRHSVKGMSSSTCAGAAINGELYLTYCWDIATKKALPMCAATRPSGAPMLPQNVFNCSPKGTPPCGTSNPDYECI